MYRHTTLQVLRNRVSTWYSSTSPATAIGCEYRCVKFDLFLPTSMPSGAQATEPGGKQAVFIDIGFHVYLIFPRILWRKVSYYIRWRLEQSQDVQTK